MTVQNTTELAAFGVVIASKAGTLLICSECSAIFIKSKDTKTLTHPTRQATVFGDNRGKLIACNFVGKQFFNPLYFKLVEVK